MEKVQIHYEPDGTYIGHHPNVIAQAVTQGVFDDIEQKGQAFREFLDTIPNNNAEYQPALDHIADEFVKDGLDIAPVSILGHEDYIEARRVLGGQDNFEGDAMHGAGGYSAGRISVDEEFMPDAKEIFGEYPALGTVIHEAAHSTALPSPNVVSTKIVEREDEEGGRDRVFSSLGAVGGFNKHVHKNMELGFTGSFWEEAFADLTRVRYSQRLGIEPHLSKHNKLTSDSLKLAYVSESTDLAEIPEGYTIMPAQFAGAINDEGEQAVVGTSSSSFAAYGLDLLDRAVPGLFEEMQASRQDPVRQREVIKMINSVRPGLYTDLRDLPYNNEGFRQGLAIVEDALSAPHVR